MDYFILNRIGEFLQPYEMLINNSWFKLENDYIEIYNHGFIGYNTYAYRMVGKMYIHELVRQDSILFFEDGLPEDVVNYIDSVDRYQEARLALEAIFRKVANHYDNQAAYSLAQLIPELPDTDLASKYSTLKFVLEDLRENNVEQLEAIKKINIDRLLLK